MDRFRGFKWSAIASFALSLLLVFNSKSANASCILGAPVSVCFSDAVVGASLPLNAPDWGFASTSAFANATSLSQLEILLQEEYTAITSISSVRFAGGIQGFTIAALGKLGNLNSYGYTALCFLTTQFAAGFEPSISDPFHGPQTLTPALPKCAGTVWAWGYNGFGQLGNGTNTNSNLPIIVTGLTEVVAIAGGTSHSLALNNNGTVWAWGDNFAGQLGNGTNINSNVPVAVSGLTGVIAISGGDSHSVALKSDGTVWAWGDNTFGQLGNGANINSNVPVAVMNLTGVVAIAAGDFYSLALKNDGTVWAWGNNGNGRLGNGTFIGSFTPVAVSNLTGVVAIAAGGGHSLALKNDETVWAWGLNFFGELGNGTNTDSNVPVLVTNLAGAVAITAGVPGEHSSALKNDGTVWAWGDNNNGELGNGTTTSSNTPVGVIGLTEVAAITNGGAHTLAIGTDSMVRTWGSNVFGELGNGTTTSSNSPVVVNNLTGVVATAAGSIYSLAFVPSIATDSLSTNKLIFGEQSIGTTSAVQSVTLSSTGNASLNIVGISIGGANPGDFSLASTATSCPYNGGSVASGSSCSIDVTFSPTITGTRTATLIVTDNTSGSPHTVTLIGTGLPASFLFNINPGSYTGLYNVDSSIAPPLTGPTTVNLAPGTHILLINPISIFFTIDVHGQITGTNNPTALSISGNTISFNTAVVTIDPGSFNGIYNLYSISGNFTGRQSFTIVAGVSLYVAVGPPGNNTINCSVDATGQLSNVNIPSAATTSGNILSFNNTVVIVNPGAYKGWYFFPFIYSAPFTGIQNIVVVPGLDFSIDNGLFSGNSSFTATADINGQLTIKTNSSAATVSGNTLSFNNVNVIIDPAAYNGVLLTSARNSDGLFGKQETFVFVPGLDYGLDNGFGDSFPLQFTIDALGNVNKVNVPAGAAFAGNTLHLQTVPIVIDPGFYNEAYTLSIYNGFGVVGPRTLELIPGMHYGIDGGDFLGPRLSFDVDSNGNVTNINMPAAAQSNGNTLLISCVGVHVDPTFYAGPYRIGITFGLSGVLDLNFIPGLPKTLFGSDQATQIGTFLPTLSGVNPPSLTTTSNGQTYGFQFTAQGCSAPARTASVSPQSLTFGNQAVGTSSQAQTVTLTNTGTSPITISGILVAGANPSDFTQVNDVCGRSLPSGASCTTSVVFNPTAAGGRNATLLIADNGSATGGFHDITLNGTGTALPIVSLSSTSLAFGDQNVGTASTALNVTLSNTGNATLNIVGITLGGVNAANFTETNTCGSSVNAGNSCTVSVTFTPATTGARAGTLTITDNASTSPQTISLAGRGINTPTGTNIVSAPVDTTTGSTPVNLTFSTVTQAGITSLTTSAAGNSPPTGFNVGNPPTYYQLSTTAVLSGSVSICINYAGVSFTNPSQLRMFHFESGAWIDVTTSLDTVNSIICGSITSLSPFAIFQSAYSATVQPPIDAKGASVFNAKRGVVPVKFTLALNGAPTCHMPPATIAVFRTSGSSTRPLNQSDYIMPSDNGSNFRVDGCQYIYNLGSGELGPGSYLIQITVSNVVVGTANFGLQ